MSAYRLRPADEEDLPALLRILDGAVDWLGSQGTDQWAGARWRADELRPDIATGGLRVAEIPVDARLTPGGSPSRLAPGGVSVLGEGAVGSVLPLVSGGVSVVGEGAASPVLPLVPGGVSAAEWEAAGSSPVVGEGAVGSVTSPMSGAVSVAGPAFLAAGKARAESPATAEAHSGPIPVGTMTLRDSPGDDPWQPGDDPDSALYLHHLAVDRAFAGRGVGAWLIDRAAEEAVRRGKRALRLDAWTANTRLHAYYLGQGFRLVRIDRGTTSGALFERPVSLR